MPWESAQNKSFAVWAQQTTGTHHFFLHGLWVSPLLCVHKSSSAASLAHASRFVFVWSTNGCVLNPECLHRTGISAGVSWSSSAVFLRMDTWFQVALRCRLHPWKLNFYLEEQPDKSDYLKMPSGEHASHGSPGQTTRPNWATFTSCFFSNALRADGSFNSPYCTW